MGGHWWLALVGTGRWHWGAQVGGTAGGTGRWHFWAQVCDTAEWHRWVHCWAQVGGTAGHRCVALQSGTGGRS
ncbi:unnamed protein product [Staurois parvus]|uniref:Secreted protein n=1 Tax=Staurois parvus TaxID=386267 RepID=A0ABN9CCY0_9NEOB|nr:unnamed protein product [Staurois parvus]